MYDLIYRTDKNVAILECLCQVVVLQSCVTRSATHRKAHYPVIRNLITTKGVITLESMK